MGYLRGIDYAARNACAQYSHLVGCTGCTVFNILYYGVFAWGLCVLVSLTGKRIERFIHIFDLLGVRSSYYKPSRSVINEKYHPQKHRKLQVGRVYE